MSFQSAYAPNQIASYESYISLPAKYRLANSPAQDLSLLTALHVHQIARIPYDNLELHYSNSRQLSLDPQDLYVKLTRNGRGGYCMENTVFFKHVLRAYGFYVYSTGARIRLRQGGIPYGPYLGWSHSVNHILLPNNTRYVSDVSFGGDGPLLPLPLIADTITQNLGSQQLRLHRNFIPHQTHGDEEAKMWIYQYRNAADAEWNSFYAFTATEFLEQDFVVMNHFTSTSPLSFSTYTAVVVKFLLDEGAGEGGEGRIRGKVMLVNGEVKMNEGGKTRVLVSCRNEEERVAALREYFDLVLTEEQRVSIRGFTSELKGV